jgi:hypothetical protein
MLGIAPIVKIQSSPHSGIPEMGVVCAERGLICYIK